MQPHPRPRIGVRHASLEWGGYRDQVDELEKLIPDNAAAWDQMRSDFDARSASLTAAQAECVDQLAEATAAKNADQLELAE